LGEALPENGVKCCRVRLGPSMVMYANHFLDADPLLTLSLQESVQSWSTGIDRRTLDDTHAP
jgi:hypothetical protein